MRALIFLHRWLGVALSVLFFVWFLSGIVLMYRTFPAVTPADRLARLPAIDAASIQITPDDAYARLGWRQSPDAVHLTSVDGRPAYRFEGAEARGRIAFIYADDGRPRPAVSAAMIDRAAVGWSGRPLTEATKESVTEVDQWIVSGPLRTLRPLYKYSWPDGQQVYVNSRTGEVGQYTTRSSRTWAYLGAIPHWLYFTPLRQYPGTWLSTVVWLSIAATVAAVIGLVIALWFFSPRKRYRYAGKPSAIPYREWKRWHTIAGLSFGVITVTWAFSGTLSLGPFAITDWISRMTAGAEADGDSSASNLATVLRGSGYVDMASYSARTPADAIRLLGGFGVREIEFRSFGSDQFYLATNARGETRIVPIAGEPRSGYDANAVMDAVRNVGGTAIEELRLMEAYDAYYFDRRGLRPLPVIYARLSNGTRYYVDPKTVVVAGTYAPTNWIDRWLYRGLHSFAFPGLYTSRPLWDIVVITLLVGGAIGSATGIILAWQVLARKVSGLTRQRR